MRAGQSPPEVPGALSRISLLPPNGPSKEVTLLVFLMEAVRVWKDEGHSQGDPQQAGAHQVSSHQDSFQLLASAIVAVQREESADYS